MPFFSITGAALGKVRYFASALAAQPGCTAIECNPVMLVGRDMLAVDAVLEYAE